MACSYTKRVNTQKPLLWLIRHWNWLRISLEKIRVNTWQAYRRFDKEGADTFWGWIHGGFALGFYTGNLYGSHKAARRQNQKKFNRLQHDTEALVFPVLD